MNTFQLECFLSVANFLNFSKAAKSLNITQPAISHQINALETELGAKLFFRTSKNVRLTQAGHLFTQYAEEILLYASTSDTLTGIDGVYVGTFIAIPMTKWLYEKLTKLFRKSDADDVDKEKPKLANGEDGCDE